LIVFQPIADPEIKRNNPVVTIHYILSHLVCPWLLSEEQRAMTEVLWAKLGELPASPYKYRWKGLCIGSCALLQFVRALDCCVCNYTLSYHSLSNNLHFRK